MSCFALLIVIPETVLFMMKHNYTNYKKKTSNLGNFCERVEKTALFQK